MNWYVNGVARKRERIGLTSVFVEPADDDATLCNFLTYKNCSPPPPPPPIDTTVQSVSFLVLKLRQRIKDTHTHISIIYTVDTYVWLL